jgi:hypothetical protein
VPERRRAAVLGRAYADGSPGGLSGGAGSAGGSGCGEGVGSGEGAGSGRSGVGGGWGICVCMTTVVPARDDPETRRATYAIRGAGERGPS